MNVMAESSELGRFERTLHPFGAYFVSPLTWAGLKGLYHLII